MGGAGVVATGCVVSAGTATVGVGSTPMVGRGVAVGVLVVVVAPQAESASTAATAAPIILGCRRWVVGLIMYSRIDERAVVGNRAAMCRRGGAGTTERRVDAPFPDQPGPVTMAP
jgi:hypothetical protein